MTREAFIDYCAGLEGAGVDCPFSDDLETTVARHTRSRRWFAILMNREGRDFANLKCEPLKGGMLRGMFTGIRPGWHMNKDHWISVDLAGDVPDELIRQLVADSHALTAPRLRRLKPSG